MNNKWLLEDALFLCRKLEEIAPRFGAHVALTGGCLYKDGLRKDVDIMFYRIRGQAIDITGLLNAIESDKSLSIMVNAQYGWLHKAVMGDYINGPPDKLKMIDFFFPEEPDMGEDEYEHWKEAQQ